MICLPNEILEKIGLYLSHKNVNNMRCVCKETIFLKHVVLQKKIENIQKKKNLKILKNIITDIKIDNQVEIFIDNLLEDVLGDI